MRILWSALISTSRSATSSRCWGLETLGTSTASVLAVAEVGGVGRLTGHRIFDHNGQRGQARASLAVLCRLRLGLDRLPVDQALGDLDGVERRALVRIVGHDPQQQPTVDGRVLADAA